MILIWITFVFFILWILGVEVRFHFCARRDNRNMELVADSLRAQLKFMEITNKALLDIKEHNSEQ